MTSGPCVVMAIEGENAVARYREVMGPTDSKKAPAGTIRHKYGTDIEKNAVHGSDSPDNARLELGFFFTGWPTRRTGRPAGKPSSPALEPRISPKVFRRRFKLVYSGLGIDMTSSPHYLRIS